MIKYFYIFVLVVMLDYLKVSRSAKVQLPKVEKPDFDDPMLSMINKMIFFESQERPLIKR